MLPPHKRKEFINLIKKYLQGKSSEKENKFLEQYYNYFDKKELISSGLSSKEKELLESKLLQQIHQQISSAEKNPVISPFKKYYLRFAAAAAILILLLSGIYIWRRQVSFHSNTVARKEIQRYKNDVPPGGNKAVLTLSNGSTIILDNSHNGIIAQQGGSKIVKVSGNQLAYNHVADDKAQLNEVLYNTITTPRGGQYQIILPDGSKVWLNDESSLKFPTAFTGKERLVTLVGEAYFEVVHDKAHPFKVQAGNIEIEDLGTHFNIMAYNDEPAIKTTLLEGAVKITNGNKNALLSPGEQAVVNRSFADIKVMNADVDQAIAWKNGSFSFNNTDIYSIMRQISRWYDVDVTFEDSLHVYLNGSIRRNVNVSQVFKMLKLTGEVEFKISGRNIIVLKPD